MTNSDDVMRAMEKLLVDVADFRQRYDQAVNAAVVYKRMYHEMQDSYVAALDELATRGNIIKAQREIIGRLEKRLGIDDDL